jgi:hypothetical protein
MMTSPDLQTHTTEVWAMLRLAKRDAERIRGFFINVVGIRDECITRGIHLTVYHSRRNMPGIEAVSEAAKIALYAEDTRFMVLAPGGENPRPELDPARRKVGVRVKRGTTTRLEIEAYRDRLIQYESREVLGLRKASTHRTNAFGARHFQPHMTLLQAGSGIDRNLTKIGELFRSQFGCFHFDRFEIKIRNVPRLPRGANAGSL